MRTYLIRTRTGTRGPYRRSQIEQLVRNGRIPISLHVIDAESGQPVSVADILFGAGDGGEVEAGPAVPAALPEIEVPRHHARRPRASPAAARRPPSRYRPPLREDDGDDGRATRRRRRRNDMMPALILLGIVLAGAIVAGIVVLYWTSTSGTPFATEHLTIEMPRGWDVVLTRNPQNGQETLVASELEGNASPELGRIVVTTGPATGVPGAGLAPIPVPPLAGRSGGATPVVVNGMTARRVVAEVPVGGGLVKTVTYFFSSPRGVAIVTCGAGSSRFPALEETFDRSVRSLRFR